MKFDLYYADLQVRVTIDAESPTTFAELTDNEVLGLQQIVYLALNSFLITRALNAKEIVEFAARMGRKMADINNKPDGG